MQFNEGGFPKVDPAWNLLGSGVVSRAYALPSNRVLKIAGNLDGTLQWLEYCHALLRKLGPDHPRMEGKPRVYQLRRFTDKGGQERYWCIMERLVVDECRLSYYSTDSYKRTKKEASRVLGMSFLDDHSGNVMYRRDADGEVDYDHPILTDPTAASYERDRPSLYKHLSAPKALQ